MYWYLSDKVACYNIEKLVLSEWLTTNLFLLPSNLYISAPVATAISSNYLLHLECQLREPVVLGPLSTTSQATIYRATLPNAMASPPM